MIPLNHNMDIPESLRLPSDEQVATDTGLMQRIDRSEVVLEQVEHVAGAVKMSKSIGTVKRSKSIVELEMPM